MTNVLNCDFEQNELAAPLTNGWKRPDYLPTPAEIEQKCAEIQQRWSPRERLRRMRCFVADLDRNMKRDICKSTTGTESLLPGYGISLDELAETLH
jgi:hypothetical protein